MQVYSSDKYSCLIIQYHSKMLKEVRTFASAFALDNMGCNIRDYWARTLSNVNGQT
jgi:hypothetical protein